VEAAEKSGSLITARLAAELGREVLAVPGRITAPESRGANRLIQDGAHVAMGWEDVVAVLPERWKAAVVSDRVLAAGPAAKDEADASNSSEVGPAGSRLLALLGEDPVDIDQVIDRSGMGAGRVSATLLDLELEGRVRQIEGKRFVRVGRG
jgi:DNA processing protein